MDKQELKNEIEKIRIHLVDMEKMLEQCEYERWKPKIDDIFYSLNGYGEIKRVYFCNDQSCRMLYKAFNCFQTLEQAEAESEKILVRRMLEDIARRLNKGKKINWADEKQHKYSIYIDTITDEITWRRELRCKAQGSVYCLNLNFYNVAKSEIGEERLKKYLKGE